MNHFISATSRCPLSLNTSELSSVRLFSKFDSLLLSMFGTSSRFIFLVFSLLFQQQNLTVLQRSKPIKTVELAMNARVNFDS